MKNKKWAVVVLLIYVCFSVFGCGKNVSKEGSGNQPLKLWVTTLGQEAETIKSVTESVWNKEHPETPVEVTIVPGNSDDYYQKLSAAFATNNGPDMFCISNASSLKYVESNIAYDVTKWIEPNKNDYLEAALNAVTFDGKMLAFPGNMDLMGIYCNNKMFKEASVEIPSTWGELIEAVNKLAKDDRYGIIVQTDDQSGYQLFEFYPFLWMCDGDVVSDEGKAVIDSAAAKKAFSFYNELLNAKGTCKKVENSNTDITPFGTERTAMQICGSWAITALKEKYPEIDYTIIPYPVESDDMKQCGVIGGWQYMVSARGNNPEKSAEFLNWLWNSDTEIPIEAATKEGKFSPRTSVMEAAKEHYSTYPYNIFTEQILPVSRIEPSYPTEVVDAVGDALQDAVYSNKSIEDILNAAQKKCEKALE